MPLSTMNGAMMLYLTTSQNTSITFFLPVIRMEHIRDKTAAWNFRDLPKEQMCLVVWAASCHSSMSRVSDSWV
jgi:hypothetical protein